MSESEAEWVRPASGEVTFGGHSSDQQGSTRRSGHTGTTSGQHADLKRSAITVAIVEGGGADQAGLEPDVVTSFDGTDIETTADLTSAIRDSEPGQAVELGVVGAGARTVEVTLGERPLTQ